MNDCICEKNIKEFRFFLYQEERSQGTIGKYVRDVAAFQKWLAGRTVSRETAIEWKGHLIQKGYAPVTINSMLSSINSFFSFMGWRECKVKFLRIQRRVFQDPAKELSREDYLKLVAAARGKKKERLAILMETICSTGIRVSEVKYVTVQAVKSGRTEIVLKGKIWTILFPGKLRKKLLQYAKEQKIEEGEIFVSKTGKGLSRCQIWQEMKRICDKAGVKKEKVFPHNLRHLFAMEFYRDTKDIVQLSDILGHSSMETTRIYLISTGKEHMEKLDRLRLIS